ncbi:MAG: transporter substrate-binding domain-containing protein [Myxococcota bacterium]
MIRTLPALALALLFVGPARASAQERTLVVGTREAAPFSMRSPDGSWSGISIELWRSIAEDLELSFELRELELDELIRGLEDGSLDVVAAALTVTESREERVDFSHPYHSSGLGIAVEARPAVGLLGALRGFPFGAFFRALTALLAVLLAAGAVVWLFERRHNAEQFGGDRLRGLGQAFWWSAVTMTTVGYGDKAPKTLGGRFFALIWMFMSVVVISGLTAAIASTLTVGQLQTDIASPRDLTRYQVATVAGTTSEDWLSRNGIRMRKFETAREGLHAVDNGELKAAVYDAPLLQHLARTEFQGRIQVLPYLLETQAYAFGLAAGSPLRERLNRVLLRETSRPSWPLILQRYLGEPGG